MKKKILNTSLSICLVFFIACGGGDGTSPEQATGEVKSMFEKEDNQSDVPASKRITLNDKGVGQIQDLSLPEEIDQTMALAGAELFKTNCTACHKIEERFIGPSPKGILQRRSPEWIMNMILDPQLMVSEDRCAKDLLVEFNGAAMANQNMTVEQARSILEYFRTL
ncbi:MAG: cytochrome c [Vicingaceae bacterium]